MPSLLALQVGPAAYQSRREVLQLGQFDLEFSFMALGTQCEDVQNQAAAIDHPAFEGALQVALLTGRQVMIEHHDVSFVKPQRITDLGHLALAGKHGRVGACPLAGYDGQRLRAGAADQQSELGKALGVVALAEIELNQYRPFAAGRTLEHQDDGLNGIRRTARSNQSASASWAKLTGRAGTTVEMACLYTIWVTVFLSRTTYWSKDSICPCNLMPLTR
jgi:hypothetical protein